MDCQAVQSWTLCGLVVAFFDLAIAYFLLCASTVAFFASKFLGFIGLSLPCPCNGLFGVTSGNYCFHRLLVDCPTERVSSVQLSVKSKFPFELIRAKDHNYRFNLRLIEDRKNKISGFVELEGEGSCSSGSEKSQSLAGRDLVRVRRNEVGHGIGGLSSQDVKQGKFDLKGKRVLSHRPRYGLRRRPKHTVEFGNFSTVSSPDPAVVDVQGAPPSSSSINKEEMSLDNLPPADFGGHANDFQYDEEAVAVMRQEVRDAHGPELDEHDSLDEGRSTEKVVSIVEAYRSNILEELNSDGTEEYAIGSLKQALEEERAAREALYLELEEERSAAASAADEAMAMILRLQEEKASIEMEARQYQRMIEEKSAYDAEEMNILKEILVRRETEKHFLEKEVEAYREMAYLENEQLEDTLQGTEDLQGQPHSSLDLHEDPILMLHQLSNTIGERRMAENRSSDIEIASVDEKTVLVTGKALHVQDRDGGAEFSKQRDLEKHYSRSTSDVNPGFQEKGMISMSRQREGRQFERSLEYQEPFTSEPHDYTQKTIPLIEEVREQDDHAIVREGTGLHSVRNGNDADQENDYLHSSKVDMEPHIHDVHVIDDDSILHKEVAENITQSLSVTETSNIHSGSGYPSEFAVMRERSSESDLPSTSRVEAEPELNRSSSDTTIGLPPISGNRFKTSLSDMRRSSFSAVDNERLMIDTEVGLLRERLRIVQEGREKLNFSVEHREKEKVQLQILEDIACQLREIRQLTEPGKAVRQASLPPPATKVIPKKIRCRSVSSGVHNSS